MRPVLLSAAAALLVGCGQNPGGTKRAPATGHDDHGHAHGGEAGHAGHGQALGKLRLLGTQEFTAGTPATLRLTVPDAAGKPLKTFAVSHDARAHLIVIRQGLDVFEHLHPDIDPGTGELSARYTFPVGGPYHLFVDYQEPGKTATTAAGTVHVEGTAPPAPPLVPDVPGRRGADGVAADVSVEGAAPGAEAAVRFELFSGAAPVTDLEPYMGALGHLVVVSADGSRYVHAHPAEGPPTAKHVVAFGATFPAAGRYKGWGQFKRGGKVLVVPFVVEVK